MAVSDVSDTPSKHEGEPRPTTSEGPSPREGRGLRGGDCRPLAAKPPTPPWGGAARSPGQEDSGLAAPPHGIEHGKTAAARATAAPNGQSHSVHHAQEPGHRSFPATASHLSSRPSAAITEPELPAAAQGDDANPGAEGGAQSQALF